MKNPNVFLFLKYILIGAFIIGVLYKSNHVSKTFEGIQTKKNTTTNDKKVTKPTPKSKSAPYATIIIDTIRKIPLYNMIPRNGRTMFENLISFIIFI